MRRVTFYLRNSSADVSHGYSKDKPVTYIFANISICRHDQPVHSMLF